MEKRRVTKLFFSHIIRKNEKMSKFVEKKVDNHGLIWYIINCHPENRVIKNVLNKLF